MVISLHGPDDMEAVAAALKGRPRKTLGWRTPAEALDAVFVRSGLIRSAIPITSGQ
ncbi:hypothetical protein GH815_18255 [Rhodovulum strictum]|uniref:Uncharacterized protein n=1 Tax=Rhodovulum strictum TaxID=58314 RepID=A0A844B990_9RHOB|nr:hypothetical protein [Rhodovulum strictum]